MTKAGWMGMAAVILAAFVVDAVVDDRVIPEPPGQVSVPEETHQTRTLSDDLSEWDVTGPGEITAADEKGEPVWTAKGDGFVTWPQPVADLVLDIGFRLPKGAVDSGAVVRIPGADLGAGVEVTMDADADGTARVGYVEGLVDPLVFVDARPNDWHTLRVTVSGERVLVHADGRHIADWVDLEEGEGRMVDQGSVALRFSDGISFRGVELAESTQVSEIE